MQMPDFVASWMKDPIPFSPYSPWSMVKLNGNFVDGCDGPDSDGGDDGDDDGDGDGDDALVRHEDGRAFAGQTHPPDPGSPG